MKDHLLFQQDQNDNPPDFNNITVLTHDVLENVPVGTFVGEFEVIDIDDGLFAESNFSLSGIDAEM